MSFLLTILGTTFLPAGCVSASKPKKFGIQLFSLRDYLDKDIEDVIKKVSGAGYSYIEAYGYSAEKGFWGLSPKAFKALLDKNKLSIPSAHFDFDKYQQTGDLEIIHQYIEVARTLNSKYIVIPYADPSIYKSESKTIAWLLKINIAAKLVKDAGLKLAYHNHDIEFFDLGNGKTAYDMLLNGTDPKLVDFEMDIYWVVKAKRDPIKLFKDHPGRFSLWHIKDMNKANPKRNTEIGSGEINFLPIFKEAKLAGLKYPIMEQENFQMDVFESITQSAKYLKEHL